MSPPQAREAGIIAVCSDPLGVRLNGEGRKECITDNVPPGTGCPAQFSENVPVSLPGGDRYAGLVLAQGFHELKCDVEGCGLAEDSGVRHDTDHAAQYEVGKPKGCFGVKDLIQPVPIPRLVFGVLMRVDQQINAYQDYRLRPYVE